MEKVNVSKLEKEFNSNNEFNIEDVINLTNTKDNGKIVRKLLSNFGNYDDIATECRERIVKENEELESYKKAVEKYEVETSYNYIDEENKVLDETNIVGKISACEKKLKILDEDIKLIKEEGSELSEKIINNRKRLEDEIFKLNEMKSLFNTYLSNSKKQLEQTETKIKEDELKEEEFGKKARETYFKIIKLTEFGVTEIKKAKKELTSANSALTSFYKKNGKESFTKLSIEEQKNYSEEQYELQNKIIEAGSNFTDTKDKYLKLLATIVKYTEEYPTVKENIDPIISKLDAESKKLMESMDIVEVIDIEEPEKDNTISQNDTPVEEPKEEVVEEQEEVVKEEEIEEPRRFFKAPEPEKDNTESMSMSEYMAEWKKENDPEKGWMNEETEEITAEPEKEEDNEKAAIDSLIAKIKALNSEAVIDDKEKTSIDPIQETKEVKEELKTVEEPIVESEDDKKSTQDDVQELINKYNKVLDDYEIKEKENESSYTEFNSPEEDDYIDSSEDEIEDASENNTGFIDDYPFAGEPSEFELKASKVIVGIKQASVDLIYKAKDGIAKFFLNAEAYQAYKARKEDAQKVKE